MTHVRRETLPRLLVGCALLLIIAGLPRPSGAYAAQGERSRAKVASPTVRSEMLGRVAAEFDAVHNIHRAVEVGSVDAVISAPELRPRIIAAIEASSG